MINAFDKKMNELRITRAYIALLLVPEGKSGERTISLMRVGDYEIRMVEIAHSTPTDDAPLFWLEVHSARLNTTVDSCSCHDLEQAASALEQLISHIKSNEFNFGTTPPDASVAC